MRFFPGTLSFFTAILVIACMTVIQVGPVAAGLAPSRTSGTTAIGSIRDADMVLATRALENKVVAQKLQDYGVVPADAQARLASMSDRDLHTLATASKGLPSGGDASGGIIAALVVVVLVIVVIRLLHHDVVVR